MGNVFPTETRLHQKYDLKGSTYGRTAGLKRSDPNATLKVCAALQKHQGGVPDEGLWARKQRALLDLQDLDVDFRLELRDTYYKQLMAQIEADAALLERMHVMDYSLLLGIHFVTPDDPWYPAPGAGSKVRPSNPEPGRAEGKGAGYENALKCTKRQSARAIAGG